MIDSFDADLTGLVCRSAAPGADIDALAQRYPAIPAEYLAFLARCDGAAGAVGNKYIALWSAADVVELNDSYAVADFAPGLVLFGTDGGDEGFGFDLRDTAARVVQMPLIGMDWSEASPVAADFRAFLKWLRES